MLNGAVQRGSLNMTWSFDAVEFNRPSMQGFADAWARQLSAVVAVGSDLALARRTPSDWPLSRLTQGEMDAVISWLPASHRDGSVMQLSPLQVTTFTDCPSLTFAVGRVASLQVP